VWRYLNMGIAVIPAAGGGVTQKTQEFTSTGTFVTPSNCSAVEVLLVGGGGGGGATSTGGGTNAGGGGGGQVVKTMLTVTPGSSYTVTIGAGGAGGATSNATGSNGGNSSFGSLITCGGGGGGGARNTNGTNGNAGTNARGGGQPGGMNSSFSSTQTTGTGGSGGGAGSDTIAVPGATGGGASMAGLSIRSWSNAGYNIYSNPTGLYGFGAGGGTVPGENYAGLNANANTGDGGWGARDGGTTLRSGGNGGSGYCLVTYWS
jgi:hypothetical protein